MISEAHNYDPRYDRAQTVEGAKARYVSDDLPEYGIGQLESDVSRVLSVGEHPDKRDVPVLEGQQVYL